MSAKVLGLVLEHFPARDAQELAVAVILADAADHDGSHVFPSVARVARLARTSERTVQRALASFKDAGFLSVKRLGGGRGRPTEYGIAVGWLLNQPSVLIDLQKGDHLSPIPERVTDVPQTPQNPDKMVTKGCHSYDTQPVYLSTYIPTTTFETPAEWLEAVEVEIENVRKLKGVTSEDGLRASIIKRYMKDNKGPGPGILKQLEARKRAAERQARPSLPEPQKSSPSVARLGLDAAKRALWHHKKGEATLDKT